MSFPVLIQVAFPLISLDLFENNNGCIPIKSWLKMSRKSLRELIWIKGYIFRLMNDYYKCDGLFTGNYQNCIGNWPFPSLLWQRNMAFLPAQRSLGSRTIVVCRKSQRQTSREVRNRDRRLEWPDEGCRTRIWTRISKNPFLFEDDWKFLLWRERPNRKRFLQLTSCLYKDASHFGSFWP